MKLQPPKLHIPPNDPYLNDLFNREQLGSSLTQLLQSVEENVVLCIDAPWGSGKTSFAQMWIADLKRGKKNCIYYDAYLHDYSDDPFVSFCAEIISLAESNFGGDDRIKSLKEDFKQKAKRVGGQLLCTGTRIGIKALTLGVVDSTDIAALVSIKEDLASSTAKAASALVERALEDYTSAKDSLTEFRTTLAELGTAVRKAQGFPLVIVIDELDRCRPDFALSLIERIKHVFSTDNVSFLLLANMNHLEGHIRTVYGSGVDGRNYLRKFVTVTGKLPRSGHFRYDKSYQNFVDRLASHYNKIDRKIHPMMVQLFRHYEFSLREMEHCYSQLSLYYSQLPPGGRLTDVALVGLLVVIKSRYASVFDKLAAGELSYSECVQSIDFDGRDKWLTGGERMNATLKHCLFSQEEFDALDSEDKIRNVAEWLDLYTAGRTEFIPFLCAEISQFGIQDD